MEFWTKRLPLFYTDMWKPPPWAAWVKGFHQKLQELTFSSIGHFSLSQWFRTSSLNAPVLPTVLCWILAIVVASFTISIIPTGGGTQFDADWGLGPDPEEGWLCLCWVEGRKLFSRFMLLVFLGARETKGGGYGNCVGRAFNIPDEKRKGLVSKGNKEELFYVLSISFLTWQPVPFPFLNYRVKCKWLCTLLKSETWRKICLTEIKMLNVCKST